MSPSPSDLDLNLKSRCAELGAHNKRLQQSLRDQQDSFSWLASMAGGDSPADLESLLTDLKLSQQEASQRADDMQWLNATIGKLNDCGDREAIEVALNALCERLGVSEALLRVFDSRPYSVVAVGLSPTLSKCSSAKDMLMPVVEHIGDVVMDLVLERGGFQFSCRDELPESLTNDPVVERVLQELQIVSGLIRPVYRGGLCVAAIEVSARQECQWQSGDTRLAEALGEAVMMVYEQILKSEALEASRQRHQLIQRASQDSLWDWNLETNEIYFSSNYCRMLGYEPGEISHFRDFARHLHPQDMKEIVATGVPTLAGDKVHESYFRLRDRSGREFWVQSYAIYTDIDSDGKPRRLVGSNRDITEMMEQQHSLEQARIEADTANAAKGEFMARMSHEIRTPMNAILGMAHLVKDTPLLSQQRDYVEHIDQAAQSLLGIINDVLDFSKIEAGKLTLEQADFDLEALFEQVSRVAGFRAQQKDVELVFDVDHRIPQLLSGDELRLNQIFTNLVGNAVKFTERGEIVIRARLQSQTEQGYCIDFQVQDSGIGMEAEQLTSLFDPFTQADGSISRRYGGTGLGLSIVERLVELMGGGIVVESTPGKGSTFTVSVTLRAALGDREVGPRIQLQNQRILVVDDNEVARLAISSTARSLGLAVEAVGDASAALAHLRQNQNSSEPRIGLVLMDYRMPGMDGLEATRIIKSDNQLKHLPDIVMVSAMDRELLADDPAAALVDAFLTKPVSQSGLYNAISEVQGAPIATSEGGASERSDQQSLPQPEPPSVEDLSCYSGLQGLRVLLTEDNVVNQKVAVAILKKRGVKVAIANNGQEAIQQLMADPDAFDVVLMDIEMPEVDGYQATHFIRSELKSDIPIIAMTAHAMRGDREKCLAATMDDYLSKPISPEKLYALLLRHGQKSCQTLA